VVRGGTAHSLRAGRLYRRG